MLNAPITLTGPNPAQPFDIQTQQAQLAQQQALAYAMLQQYMSPTAPTIHTGGGNPFARDVVNLAPVGNVIASALTGKRVSGLNQQQQELANQYMQRRLDELNTAFSPQMPSGAPSVMGTQQPPMLDIATRLIRSQVPQNAQLGATILSQIAKGEEARQFTPATGASYVRAGVDPSSLHFTQGVFGFPQQTQADVNAMRVLPKPTDVPATNTLYAFQPQNPSATAPIAQPTAPPATVTPPGGALPGGSPNPNPVAMQTEPRTGEHVPIPGPVLAGSEKGAELSATGANEGADMSWLRSSTFAQEIPTDIMMAKIAQGAVKYGGNFGGHGEIINDIRKLFAQVGLNPDKANNITNYELFRKMAVPAVTSHMRQDLGARISNIEFTTQLEALGAGGNTDPRALLDLTTQRLMNGANMINAHNTMFLPRLVRTNPELAKQYELQNIDIGRDVIKPLQEAGIQTNWKKLDNGNYIDQGTPVAGVTAPSLFSGSKSATPLTLPPGFVEIK